MRRESTKKSAVSERKSSDRSPSKFILAKARVPAARAVIGLGSVMYAGAAAPQEVNQEFGQDADQDVPQDAGRKSARKTASPNAGQSISIRGSTGGVINLTSKVPLFTNFGRIDMSGYTRPAAA